MYSMYVHTVCIDVVISLTTYTVSYFTRIIDELYIVIVAIHIMNG